MAGDRPASIDVRGGWLHPDKVRPAAERTLDIGEAESLAAAFGLLVDATRLRMLHALARADELCVFDLGLLLGLEQSTVSRQLRLLRERRIVSRRREGRLAYYRLNDPSLRWFLAGLATSLGLDGEDTPPSPWSLLAPLPGPLGVAAGQPSTPRGVR